MSLYDDVDAIKQKNDPVAGWSSGIKLFQSQLQLKKAAQTQVMTFNR
jgi:splicing factor 45